MNTPFIKNDGLCISWLAGFYPNYLPKDLRREKHRSRGAYECFEWISPRPCIWNWEKGLLKTFVTLLLDNSDIYFHKCPSARPVYQVDLENYKVSLICLAISHYKVLSSNFGIALNFISNHFLSGCIKTTNQEATTSWKAGSDSRPS